MVANKQRLLLHDLHSPYPLHLSARSDIVAATLYGLPSRHHQPKSEPMTASITTQQMPAPSRLPRAGWCLVVLTLGWPSSITSDAFTVAGMLGQHGRRQPAKGFPPRLSQPIQSLPPRADPAGRSCYPSAVIINRKNNQCAKCPLKHAHLSLSARPHGQQILC